jgi:hypothetical protein
VYPVQELIDFAKFAGLAVFDKVVVPPKEPEEAKYIVLHFEFLLQLNQFFPLVSPAVCAI